MQDAVARSAFRIVQTRRMRVSPRDETKGAGGERRGDPGGSYRIGQGYIAPPWLHRALVPRARPSLLCLPTLRSKISP